MKKEHPGAREMYDFIADWDISSVIISKNLIWSRFGLLGIMGDYVLSHVRTGNILEIGVGESSILLTKLAKKFNRRVFHCDVSPGEVENCLSVPGIFDDEGVVKVCPSDELFRDVDIGTIALGFIDGDHRYEYVKRDFDNLFVLLVENGFIFIHDMYPPEDSYLSEHRCGDGYKLRQELEERTDLDIFTFPFGAMEVGLTMIRKLPENQPYYRERFTRSRKEKKDDK